jgi:hypothetical protein
MSTRWIDPDFADAGRPKPDPAADRTPRFLGMRPAFAGVATPVLVAVALAASALERADGPSTSPRPTPSPPRLWLRSRPVARTMPPRLTSIDLRMIVPARPGIDEAMIHQARPDVDPRMIVPASPALAAPEPLATEPPAIVDPRQ